MWQNYQRPREVTTALSCLTFCDDVPRNAGATGLITGKECFVLVVSKQSRMIFSNAAEAILSPVSFFVMSELPPSEPVLSLNTKSQQKDRMWIAELSSTNPVAILVKRMYNKNNNDGLHTVITVYLLSDASSNREASKHTVQVSCKNKKPAVQNEMMTMMWWTGTCKNRLPEIWIPHFLTLKGPDWLFQLIFTVSQDRLCQKPALRLPLPFHTLPHFSLSLFTPLFVWGFFLLSYCLAFLSPPFFCFSDIKREKERWWVTWGMDQSRHWEKRGLTVDHTNWMIYSAKCPDYLSCNKRTGQK